MELPDQHLTHELHLTFSRHFIMSGGNILVLQKIFDYTDITHFAPEHFENAVSFNPLND